MLQDGVEISSSYMLPSRLQGQAQESSYGCACRLSPPSHGTCGTPHTCALQGAISRISASGSSPRQRLNQAGSVPAAPVRQVLVAARPRPGPA